MWGERKEYKILFMNYQKEENVSYKGDGAPIL